MSHGAIFCFWAQWRIQHNPFWRYSRGPARRNQAIDEQGGHPWLAQPASSLQAWSGLGGLCHGYVLCPREGQHQPPWPHVGILQGWMSSSSWIAKHQVPFFWDNLSVHDKRYREKQSVLEVCMGQVPRGLGKAPSRKSPPHLSTYSISC